MAVEKENGERQKAKSRAERYVRILEDAYYGAFGDEEGKAERERDLGRGEGRKSARIRIPPINGLTVRGEGMQVQKGMSQAQVGARSLQFLALVESYHGI